MVAGLGRYSDCGSSISTKRIVRFTTPLQHRQQLPRHPRAGGRQVRNRREGTRRGPPSFDSKNSQQSLRADWPARAWRSAEIERHLAAIIAHAPDLLVMYDVPAVLTERPW